jgi:hypothetical protein
MPAAVSRTHGLFGLFGRVFVALGAERISV